MKLYFSLKYRNLLKIPNFKSQFRNASIQKPESKMESSVESTQMEPILKSKNWLIPNLTKHSIQMLNNVTGISIGWNHVSWAYISIPTLTVSNWKTYSLPYNFEKEINDVSISKIAELIILQMPTSNLYVMECRFLNVLNCSSLLCLRSMLVILLNNLHKDSTSEAKIVFLQQFVLNTLHQLLVGNERVSIKQELERKRALFSSKIKNENNKQRRKINDNLDCYSSVNFENELLQYFLNSKPEKQECLSHSLLLALTFLDLYFFENSNSIGKLLEKKKKKKKSQ